MDVSNFGMGPKSLFWICSETEQFLVQQVGCCSLASPDKFVQGACCSTYVGLVKTQNISQASSCIIAPGMKFPLDGDVSNLQELGACCSSYSAIVKTQNSFLNPAAALLPV